MKLIKKHEKKKDSLKKYKHLNSIFSKLKNQLIARDKAANELQKKIDLIVEWIADKEQKQSSAHEQEINNYKNILK